MSLADIKHVLRKFDFPASAKEALIRIEQLLVGRSAPSGKQMDIALEVISEFVFCEDRRSGRRSGGLTPLQELQLIDIICEYLSACASETTKNTLFLSLFGGADIQRQRLKILSILASMAVSASKQLLVGRSAPSGKQMDIALEVISEFVFCEDRRSGRRSGGLTPLQELQLIDIICEYLSACASETTKNTLFLSLFGGADIQRQRLKILSILASMAVSASSTPVLFAVGVWLQQMGCSSPQSLQLVENVIRDHFYLNTSNQTALKSLANTAPPFVSNFITAVTELYMQDVQGVIKMPPKNLLEVITTWVYSNPTLCMSAQLAPAALPLGSIAMAAVTPLAGLVRWCARAPIALDEDSEMVEVEVPMKKMKIEGETEHIVKPLPAKTLTESELYIKLHLGVLHSLRAGRRTHGPPTAVNAQHLAALTPMVQAYAHQLMKNGINLEADKRLQECLDRIGQAVQIALANGCVYGNISNLLAALDTLPENRLLQIIIKTHQQTI